MSTPTLSMILAISENQVIGDRSGRYKNELPWHLPDDLKFFQKNTLNKPIIMGRKTFETIGFPLPKRKNIILSSTPRTIPNTYWCQSFDEALTLVHDAPEVMIMGGAQLYQTLLPRADRLYITRVHAEVEGDVTLPAIDLTKATLLFEEHHPKDERHQYAFTFQIWDL